MFLLSSLIAAGLHVMSAELPLFKYVSAASALIGLFLVGGAASYVLRENTSIKAAMESEPSDVPELADRLGLHKR
jgi:hypothetical protein